MKHFILFIALFVLIFATACATAPASKVAPQAETSATPGAVAFNIAIVNGQFVPATIEIPVNSYVVWTNVDNLPHFVASNPHPLHTDLPGLSSGLIKPEVKYEFQFIRPGSWGYHDHLNPSVGGTIVVK